MGAALQDPKQISNTANSTAERDKNKAIPLEVMWERQYETAQSLEQEQSNAVAEAERILFPSTGSMNFTEIQVEDKPIAQEEKTSMFDPDMYLNMFTKPLEGLSNIAGSIVNETPIAIDAAGDLLKQVIGEKEKQPQERQSTQKELEETQWKNFVTQKTGEINAVISQVAMQRKMEEALYIIGEPTPQDAAEVLVSNTSMDAQNLNTIDKHIWIAKKRTENIKAAKKAGEHQDATEVQKPEIVADMEGGREGGTGRGSNIMSQAGGGE
ncbi:hypothetical protein A2111_02830 [Candidatus Daviesbacteria bacterium GWA1_38_6]|nr:MAG: hypothetical protein A2111_02830 [Candidatus Daviesbacteria bacterium GWA1_38_6]